MRVKKLIFFSCCFAVSNGKQASGESINFAAGLGRCTGVYVCMYVRVCEQVIVQVTLYLVRVLAKNF